MADLLEAMTRFVRAQRGGPVEPTVTGYREQGFREGYCHTCADSQTVVFMDSADVDGQPWTYLFAGDLRELIWKLTTEPDDRVSLLDGGARYEWWETEDEPPHTDDVPFPTYSNRWLRADQVTRRPVA
jgi:hypothetical protein